MQAAGSTLDHFQELSDPLMNRGNDHSLYEMVAVALAAGICGAKPTGAGGERDGQVSPGAGLQEVPSHVIAGRRDRGRAFKVSRMV